ncbi:hypothetical protein [Limnoglobus roseus]|uniref:Uncharacterized protein n=1 Tax=Limnoglobus roseus TaxID=2598579 RepID=A0A5C1A881_9BACT|nr:hypothetical protein [Limnoglobus roseus]QEL13344.1 hypothetical protein PX52LOC_00198 [Limnoglobus roseus]
MKRMPVRRSLAVLFAGVGTVAHAEPIPLVAQRPIRPAVQLVAVRAVAAPPETARGVPSTTPAPFDPFFDPNSLSPSRPGVAGPAMPNEGYATQPPPPQTQIMMSGGFPVNTATDPRTMAQPGQPRGVWSMLTDWTSDRTKAIKSTLGVQQQQLPDARVGQPFQQQQPFPQQAYPQQAYPQQQQSMMPMGQPYPTQPMPGQPMAGQPMPGQPFQGVTPAGRAAYAGNPAYRWYGWGTTTPGSNPYAPTGEYPSGSAQWYAMSRATPGAFPVPVTHPFRQPPGADAPAYAVRPAAPRKPVSDVPPPSFAFEPSAPSGPTAIAETPPFRYVPPDQLPVTTTVVPSVPPSGPPGGSEWRSPTMPLSSNTRNAPAVAKEETAWQPVTYTTPVTPPAPLTLVGQSLPASSGVDWQPPTLQERVQAICGTFVSAVEVKKLGTDAVIVRFNAPSDAVAERVAKAVSQLEELKPYTVTFDVAVAGK